MTDSAIDDSRWMVHEASLSDASARAAYADLLDASPLRSPFTTLAFADATADAYGLDASLLLVHEEDALEEKRVEAGLVLFLKSWGPFTALSLPPMTPVTGPVLRTLPRDSDIHWRRSALDVLLAAVAKRVDQATLVSPPGLTDVRPFLWADWTLTPRFTYHIDLTEAGPKTWNRSSRYKFRRHADEFELREDLSFVDDAIRFTYDAYERHDDELALSRSAVLRQARRIGDAGKARAFAAVRDGNVEAALISTHDDRTATNWIAGSIPGPAMTVLLGKAFKRLHADGFSLLDLAGANIPSIAEFKRSFGGRLVRSYRARLVTHPVLRALEAVRR